MRLFALLLLAACGRVSFDGADAGGADAAPVEPGLVVWLRMEDGAEDGRLEDSAGGEHPGVCVQGLTCGTTVAGHLGEAVRLDGSLAQFYRIVTDVELVTPDAFTVSAWVFVDAITAVQQTVVTKRFGTIHNTWAMYVDDENMWMFESAYPPEMGSYAQIVGAQAGVWTHVAISWDNASERGYINGVKLLDTLPPDVTFDDREVLVGMDEDDGRGRFGFLTGAIDELRIYNRKLSDFEIQQLAAQ